MDALELKIPPPVVALVLALSMWVVAALTTTLQVTYLLRLRVSVAVALALLGGAVSLAGTIAFRKARTTVNPMKPERASSLVIGGVYRFTRNPMYVGLLLVQIAWAAFLCAPWSLVGPLAFAVYITRYQINAEERVLMSLFGEAYARYKSRVRRWV